MTKVLKFFSVFLFWLLVTNSVGLLSAAYMTPATQRWYHTLPLPVLTPPDMVFRIVWPILFVFMSLAATFAWRKARFAFFWLQLLCIGLWSFMFFVCRVPCSAVIATILLMICVCMTMADFYKASPAAAFLLLPQLLWTGFALYLNGYIVYAMRLTAY